MEYEQLKFKNDKLMPNVWDLLVILIVFGLLASIAWAVSNNQSIVYENQKLIDLSPSMLPKYSALTVFRMFVALGCSLLFTFIVAPLAAKNKHFERIIIPLIDILESVPVLGFLSLAFMGLIYLFPKSSLVPEIAAIFAIFVSQVWNMTLSFYQSLITIPAELTDAAKAFKLTAWQRFWKVELPYATPNLLWNMVISMSGGWFFLVASEAIYVNNQEVFLEGVGSYIGTAVIQGNLQAIFYAIAAMFTVILLYDQLIFRPLLSWAEKFKMNPVEIEDSWFFKLLNKTKLIKLFESIFDVFIEKFVNGELIKLKIPVNKKTSQLLQNATYVIWNLFLVGIIALSGYFTINLLINELPVQEVLWVFFLGLVTAVKVFVLLIITSIIWVPVGVWIGLRPKLTAFIQPVTQFLAAFPANLFFPLTVILITKYKLNPEIWTTPLMILGTQWYILFNVIAGASNIPKNIHYLTKNLNIKGTLWWKRVALPSVFPSYITGAMAAAGGCWNACIVADVVQWGDTTIKATGLGAYITEYTRDGDVTRIVFGILVMSIYVIIINRLLWHKLYDLAVTKYS